MQKIQSYKDKIEGSVFGTQSKVGDAGTDAVLDAARNAITVGY